jgi:NADH-quinone oxidoreductase subunit M
MSEHLLSLVLFTPLAGALILLFIPANRAGAIRLWANVIALLGFLLSVPLVFQFDRAAESFQFVEKTS